MNIPLPIIVSILGFVFSILIFVIGILINVLNKNTDAIKKMEIAIAKQETADVYVGKACTDRHSYITKKLGQLSDFAQNQEIRISKLESK